MFKTFVSSVATFTAGLVSATEYSGSTTSLPNPNDSNTNIATTSLNAEILSAATEMEQESSAAYQYTFTLSADAWTGKDGEVVDIMACFPTVAGQTQMYSCTDML